MRFTTLLSALLVGVPLLARCAFAGGLAGTRLVCSGTEYDQWGPIDVQLLQHQDTASDP